MSETKISKQIKEMIEKEFPDVAIDRHHCGLARGFKGGMIKLGEPGWFDYIGYLPDGRFIGIEVKDPDGTTQKKREALQAKRREDANNKNAVGIKTDSVEDCRAKIQAALGARQ